ncbi:DUF5937 family protein [Micromonospora sp. SL1-18]|uniref:DUF5937 family protein n=1 Tax=Micromonospora sp. SL1-18 TaxID=3399128 RepID=UPI003A4D98A5
MPLIELDLAARALQDDSQPLRLSLWRQRAAARLTVNARMALSVIPAIGYSPSFHQPALPGTVEGVLEHVRTTPTKRIQADLAAIAELQPLPSWTRRLADDAAVRARLFQGISDLYTALLAPYWPRLSDELTADRAVRTRQFLTGGVERILAHANPEWARWSLPVLEIRTANGAEHDLYLSGQGILLVPTMFGTRCTVDNDAQPQPVVTYPAAHDQPLRRLNALVPEHVATGSSRALIALIGSTRAAVLEIIADHSSCTTKELAALARISPASTSEHATILREAGLIRTVRHRNTVLHSPTQLALTLLNTTLGKHGADGV